MDLTRPTSHALTAGRAPDRGRAPFSRASVLVVLVGLLLSGCASIPLPVAGGRKTEPAPALERKRVAAKRAPADLIAEDGTRCLATKRRFERTEVGSEAWCVWTGDGGRLRRYD
jgi:hypothetical protein